MTPRKLSDLSARLGAKVHADAEALATGFATDSRDVKPGDVFLAIRGAQVDGHNFVDAAGAHGAVASLVERAVDGPYLQVDNLVTALARMALCYRSEFDGPVIGITGSVGKTTAKDLTAAALAPLGPVLKSEGNRNTEYSSPLVWTELTPEHRAAVIEMGMRGFGQIAHLASFSRPTIGLITNIGYAHLELVGTREGIARAKAELIEALPSRQTEPIAYTSHHRSRHPELARDLSEPIDLGTHGVGLVWQGDDFRDFLKAQTKVRIATFGFEPEADCRITDYRAVDWESSEVQATCYGVPWRARLPAAGRHIAVSAAAAVLAAVEAGVPARDAGEALACARLAPMRMQVLERDGVRILLDTYNASPPSMIAALDTFAELPVTGRRLAIIGEMRELGDYTEEAHRLLGRTLASHRLDEVALYGDPRAMNQGSNPCLPIEITRQAAIDAGFSASRLTVASDIGDLREFVKQGRPDDAILIKGSRSLELERALE